MKYAFSRNLLCGVLMVTLPMLTLGQPTTAEGVPDAIARLKNLTGNVLVSRESGLTEAVESMRLARGTRVITTTNSQVTVVYDNGCEVTLKENQRFEVKTDKPCRELVALAQSILLEPGGMAVVGSTDVIGVYALLIPLVIGILDMRKPTSVSPN